MGFDLAGYVASTKQVTRRLSFIPNTGAAPLGLEGAETAGLEGELPVRPTLATIFLGLVTGADVTPRRRYTVRQVVAVTERLLLEIGLAGASVIAQTGILKERGKFVHEPSVQIVILEIEGLPWLTFRTKALEVGESLRIKFKQDEVYVALVNDGQSEPTWKLPE